MHRTVPPSEQSKCLRFYIRLSDLSKDTCVDSHHRRSLSKEHCRRGRVVAAYQYNAVFAHYPHHGPAHVRKRSSVVGYVQRWIMSTCS